MSTNVTPVTPFPSHAGALAPVNPDEPKDLLAQERREERVSAPRLHKYLNKTLDAIAGLDQEENLKIHNQMVKCQAYFDGHWDGDIRDGVWYDNETITGEILAKDNEYKKQIEKLLMEMSRSKIGYTTEAILRHLAAKREAAQFAQHRVTVNQDRVETEPFVQAENQSLLLKGAAYRYSFFDTNADSQEQSVALNVIRSMKEGATVKVCRTCGLKTAQTPCPNCGDTEQKAIAAPPSESIAIQQDKKPAGRVVTVRPDAMMVQMDLNARDVPTSTFIRWRLVLRRCDWEWMYPGQRIPSNKETEQGYNRSRLQGHPSNSEEWMSSEDAANGGNQFEKIEGELVWLDPKVYQRYRSQEAETLGKDKHLAPGALLTDQFPDGVCITRIADKILDLYPSNKNKCWTMCVYGIRDHALHGSGTNALLGPHEIIAEANSLILANQTYNAVGRDLLRSGAIEGGQLPPLDKVAYIQNAPEDVNDIGRWAHAKIQPSPLSGEVYGFREAMQASLQDAAGTSSLSLQGAADMKALGTATGVEASRDQAVGRMIPNRKLQAHMGAQWAMQVLELERENYSAEIFLELAEKADENGETLYSERGVETFFQSEVSKDFTIKPIEGSWAPTSPAQKQAKATEFGTLAAQIKDAANSEEILSLLAPMYEIPYSVNEFGADQMSASLRLEEYGRVAGIISQGGYPPTPEIVQVVLTNTAEWAMVDPIMDRHRAFMDYYEDWWVSPGGRAADSLLRMVVREVRELHRKGLVIQAQGQSEDSVEAKAPEMAAAEEAAAENAAQAHEQAEQDMIKQALGEAELERADREHEAEVDLEKETALNVQEAAIAIDAKSHDTDEEIRKARAVAKFTPKKPASGST